MASMGSLPSRFINSLNPIRQDGSDSRNNIVSRLGQISLLKFGFGFLVCRGVHSSGVLRKVHSKFNAQKDDNVQAAAAPEVAANSPYPAWVTWILGSILSMVLPFWKTKLMAFLKLEDEVEKAVENVAEAVEKVAEATEKAIEELEEELPADGKLKEALVAVENSVKEVQKDAKAAEQLIHKVDEMKEEVENLVGPLLNKVEAAELVKKEA
ncbi:uncharacterized protein LOC131234575 [Magnolia sinica]|uniref:uncharacterized protein LOC131234575 n=1 Tax=Magnolia sinica TaxID=86752 RepID=UPI00265A3710|nr:uncharacterized protein LOC131234575 [Magnolia sinica]